MTFELTCTIDHKTLPEPITHRYEYTGETLSDIVDQIDTLPFHRDNLARYRRTAFKSQDGVKHKWVLREVKV